MKKQTKFGLVLAAAAVLSVSVASLVSAKGWVQQGSDWFYLDNSGEAVTDTIQASGNAKFYLGEDGSMQKDYFLEDKDSQSYYFGSNGAMVTNTWVAIESSRVSNQGDRVPDNYWYYFQASGKAMKGTSTTPKKTTIDGKKYMFNEYGQMLTGWFDSNGGLVSADEENPFKTATYYAGGENDGVLRSGWVTYYDGYTDGEDYLSDKTNLYFYFNTSNNKKYGNDGAVTKKINGKTYAFNSEGVMLSGWDVFEHKSDFTTFNNTLGTLESNRTVVSAYFSGEDDGHQVKKGWVYVVPASGIDNDAYDDGEEKYMYFNASGYSAVDQIKKINGKHYVFNANGIMKTGLVMMATSTKGKGNKATQSYVAKVDLDNAKGEDFTKKGKVVVDEEEGSYYMFDWEGNITGYGNGKGTTADWVGPKDDGSNITFKLHYFGTDGARKTGSNTLSFSDNDYTFTSTNTGNKATGVSSKKYYVMGILCKASQDIRYGIWAASNSEVFQPQNGKQMDAFNAVTDARYLVLTTGGVKQKGANTAKKDADGNYWMIAKNGGNTNDADCLIGIWTQNVKYTGSSTFTTVELNDATLTESSFQDWLDRDSKPHTTPKIKSGSVSKVASGSGWKYTFTVEDSYWYQGEYGDSSSKWLPFGFNDNSEKTITFGDPNTYRVSLNDDYFLNCYWN